MTETTINKESISAPKHIAIIMDGNGRWAQKRGLPRSMGHQKGAKTVEKVVKAATELGVKYLTLYAFSTENWNRSEEEVATLIGLLREYLKKDLKEIQKHKARIKFIGERNMLDADIVESMRRIEINTKDNDDITVCLAISYGSRQEIISVVKKIGGMVQKGDILLEEVDEQTVSNLLYTNDMPDPDLVIRTSGEQRISNYLLWQIAYSEFYFTDVFWPDFSKKHLEKIIENYNLRERRFGKA